MPRRVLMSYPPRLLLEEKARKDLGTLISLFVKRLKKVNANATEVALRLSDLECRFRLKATQLEERHILQATDSPPTSDIANPVKDEKAADGARPIATSSDGQNGGVLVQPPSSKESSNEASVEGESRSEHSRVEQHAT
jgi:hypothetical protein